MSISECVKQVLANGEKLQEIFRNMDLEEEKKESELKKLTSSN